MTTPNEELQGLVKEHSPEVVLSVLDLAFSKVRESIARGDFSELFTKYDNLTELEAAALRQHVIRTKVWPEKTRREKERRDKAMAVAKKLGNVALDFAVRTLTAAAVGKLS